MEKYVVVDGPLGKLAVAFTENGITAVAPVDNDAGATVERALGRSLPKAQAAPAGLAAAVRSGDASALRFDFDAYPAFDRAVWKATLEIPAGEVRSYGFVAQRIGHPGAARAVGSALGRNPFMVLIPCHRVVRSDGSIGEYGGGGPAAKRALLAKEGALGASGITAPARLRSTPRRSAPAGRAAHTSRRTAAASTPAR